MANPRDKYPKRMRDTLEENVEVSDELESVLKRRRLAAEGVENQNPLSTSGSTTSLWVESIVKPDMLAIASVRHRVQQLTQRQHGGAILVQRGLSDAGAEFPCSSILRDVCHIGEEEFSSRLKRFKTSTPKSSTVPSTSGRCQLSSFVCNMQQQLNAAVTPSTKEASRINQEASYMVGKKVFLYNQSLNCQDEDGPDVKTKEAECSTSVSSMITRIENSFNHTSAFTGLIQLPSEGLCPPESVVEPGEQTSTSLIINKRFEDTLQASDKDDDDKETGQVEERRNEIIFSQTKKEEKPDFETVETQPHWGSLVPSLEGNETSKQKAERENKDCVNCKKDEVAEDQELHTDYSERAWTVKEESVPIYNEDDFLTLLPPCVLSPLSKSEPIVRLLRDSATPMVQCVYPEELTFSPTDSASPLYSIEAYRSETKNTNQASSCVTTGTQNHEPEKSHVKPAMETIKALSEEAAKLQTVIHQTLQALSCCSDEEHGKGSLQEAEAEKLLLVSSHKHAALLVKISRLRQEARAEPISQTADLQPCRGTLSIRSIQLPLKMEFVNSGSTGCPTLYFFILIRYDLCNIVATPLATAADAENGDTISFPTAIELQDICSNFEIDVEVYSLSNPGNTFASNVQQHHSSTRSRVTPRELLGSITKSNNCSTSGIPSALNSHRSSNFCLVGSHKITLASLGQTKFQLDKVPFLSPLAGHIYLRLHNKSHSSIEHQGFLTMFEIVGGFGAWQRFFCKLERGFLFYRDHPNNMDKPAEGSISLCGFTSLKLLERDSCARRHTFELVNMRTQQQDSTQRLIRYWFSADTQQEQADWMEKMSQVLLDLHAWNWQPAASESDPTFNPFNIAASRESIL